MENKLLCVLCMTVYFVNANIDKKNECLDTEDWCKHLVKYNPMFCMIQPEVKVKCKRSCNLCDDSCTDTHPHCGQGVSWGYCQKKGVEKTFMQTYCRKACNFCNSDCGIASLRSKRGIGEIVSGTTAKKGYYPWQAAIYYDTEFLCGGSLISNNVVLTAAHCFNGLDKNANKIVIVLGDHNRVWNEGTEQIITASNITVHESYVSTLDHHDIALVTLTTAAKANDYVTKICLPMENEELKPGTKCHLSGWGKISHLSKCIDILQEAVIPIAERSICKKRNDFNFHDVTDKMICGGYDNGENFISGCHGDSGGPLQCEINGRWHLYGAVSWGSPLCNGLDRYTVFTRISSYIPWIQNQLK